MPKLPLTDVILGRGAPAAVLGMAAALSLTACAARMDPSRASPPYPSALTQSRTLDVQVFRRANTIWLTNTTATPIGPGRLWLNAWYSRPVEMIGVGETLEMKLSSFYDRHGEPFRGGGGFFAARDPEAIVLAQIVQSPAAPPTAAAEADAESAEGWAPAQELLGLVVVGGRPTD